MHGGGGGCEDKRKGERKRLNKGLRIQRKKWTITWRMKRRLLRRVGGEKRLGERCRGKDGE